MVLPATASRPAEFTVLASAALLALAAAVLSASLLRTRIVAVVRSLSLQPSADNHTP
jgi:hypothetical protein